MITNLRYADDIILLATSEAELQELVDHLDRVANSAHPHQQDQSNDEQCIDCCILIQNEQLEQINTFPYLGSLITEDGECVTEFCTGPGDRGITAENTTNESASMAYNNVQL